MMEIKHMDEFYYVLVWDKSSFDIGSSINMEIVALESFEESIRRMNMHEINLKNTYIEYQDREYPSPSNRCHIVTNDIRLYTKFRNALTEREFEEYCIGKSNDIDDSRNNSKKNTYKVLSDKIKGNDAIDILGHVKNIIAGKYQLAYTYTSTDVWNEEGTGNRYEFTSNFCWKNKILPKKFEVLECIKISIHRYKHILTNINNPNKLYIVYSDKESYFGLNVNIDLNQLQLKEIKESEGKKIITIKPK